MSKQKRIVITGVGVVSPCGIGKKRFWDALKKGKSAIKPITLFNTKELGCKLAGEVPSFNVKRLLGQKGLRHLTRSTQFVLAASKLALDDAALPYPVPEEKTDSYGVSLGTTMGSVHSIMEFDKQALIEGPRSVNPADFPNITHNTIASHISIRFNIKGFNTTISSSFSSSLDAISYAGNMIKNYGYKVILAGGAEELSLEVYHGLIKVKCLSRSRRHIDKEISCPYDKRRNGFIFSEGACIFVLEDLEHAQKRGARIYAELKGCGSCFNPKTKGLFNVNPEGATEAIKQAIAEFGYPGEEIDYIVGSANSTPACDFIETKAIKNAFSKKAKQIQVSSIKSIIGETFSAAGAFNTAVAIGALEYNFIPPTINYRFPDKHCDLNLVTNKATKKGLNNILINAFSHDGFNSSVVIGRTDT